MNSTCTYEVIENVVVKKYSSGEKEELCLLEDIDILITNRRETLDRMENVLCSVLDKENFDNTVSTMFYEYTIELNELNKIKLLNSK